MRHPEAIWNPSPESCYTARTTPKIAWCIHRMAGWAGYLRNFDHLKANPPRKISSHFTLSLKKGDLQQHVDTDHIAWTQGIRSKDYPFCKARWPLFQGHNPNIDCVSSEMGDGAKPFNAQRELTDELYDGLRELARWLWEENVIAGEPVVGESIIGHMAISPSRPDDPGKWFMKNIAPELAIAAGGRKPRFHSIRPTPSIVRRARKKPVAATPDQRLKWLESRVSRLERKGR